MQAQPVHPDYIHPGHMACAGCGEVLAIKLVLQAAGPKTIAVVVPSCIGIIIGPLPFATFKIPVYHTAFETAAASAAGISNALAAKGDRETVVIAMAGDGGTADIGFQSLSGAADRNENIIYCCFDNEAYMNTGIQSSSSTPQHAWTTTTPLGKPLRKKNMVELMAAHKIPFAATACACFPADLREKIAQAKTLKGLKYIHILSPCPTGWHYPEKLTPNIGRLAVETNFFPLYEVSDGRDHRITHDSQCLPVQAYLELQGRYRHLKTGDVTSIQQQVDENWNELKSKHKKSRDRRTGDAAL